MSTLLYRIGSWCVRNKKKVLYGWCILIAVIFTAALLLKPTFSDDMSIPGTPSEKAMKVIEEEFPSAPDAGSARVIFEAKEDENLMSESAQKTIGDVLNSIMKDKEVDSIANPYEVQTINEDGTVAYADVTYKEAGEDLPENSLEHIQNSIKIAQDEGMRVEYTGDILPFELEVGGISEVIGIALAFIVLSVTFASFLMAGLPILTALMGLLTSIGLTFIGTKIFDISSFSLSLTVMIGLAVGIDYALFIFSKHRQQVRDGIDINESIARASGTAGGAVVFAGLTVIVALCGLSVVGIPFLAVMGMTAAISVLFAVLISMTAVPAVLAVLGKRIDPTYKRNRLLGRFIRRGNDESSNSWGRLITKHPLTIGVLGILLLLVISIPALDLRLGLPDDGMQAEEKPARQAYDLLAEGFGEGFNGPLVALVDASDTSGDQKEEFQEIMEEITKLDNVQSATPAIPNETGRYAIINVIPETGPNDEKTANLVHDLRDISVVNSNGEHLNLSITGLTAINIDIAEKLNEAIPVFATIIIGFAFILLLVVFRSLLVPLTAVAGFLLTMTATLGFSVFVLQKGNLSQLFGIPEPGPILAFLPILVIGILFGLAMDYQVFLVSRMHEEYLHTRDPERSILAGLKYSGPVVTAAGLIMIFVFAGFIFAGDPMIKSIGLALTFGVLFDAFIVRMTIIPSLMKVMGHATWYLPKWLDRIIPNVDIEGHKLLKQKEKEDQKQND
ncbi:MMPL family transporter [Terribacillus sp. 179-K 1B1 HS]|uniref:MMPL family transporter n=1 Tax=Terribacillus sp. 179-K 1B1 HS TaxID=3142388 RepID=UPI0039A1DFE6